MTDEFERTERSRILQLVRDEFQFPVVGEVQQTHPNNPSAARPSNHDATVSVPPGPDPIETYRRRPVAVPTSGVVAPPQVGDLVLLVFPRRADRPVVVGTVYGDEDRAPLGDTDDVRVNRGELYAELAGDGSSARLSKRPGDLDAPTARVEIDDQGDVTISTDGDINVSAGGDVVIDEGGTAAPVATDAHTHSVSGTTSDGASFSDTTTGPSDTTDAEIE
jgi:hypothetical protein